MLTTALAGGRRYIIGQPGGTAQATRKSSTAVTHAAEEGPDLSLRTNRYGSLDLLGVRRGLAGAKRTEI